MPPKAPAGHAAVQVASDSPVVLPYSPTAHALHSLAPPTLYLPGGHTTATADTDPDGHAYPALHSPLQTAVVEPAVDANVPAGHGAEQFAVDRPVLLPNTPMGHGVQAVAPPLLNVPTGHAIAVAFADPETGQ